MALHCNTFSHWLGAYIPALLLVSLGRGFFVKIWKGILIFFFWHFTLEPLWLEGYSHIALSRHMSGWASRWSATDFAECIFLKCWRDFVWSKLDYGIVWTCSCAPSLLFAHLPHTGMPMGQKLVKSGIWDLWSPDFTEHIFLKHWTFPQFRVLCWIV